MFIAPLCKATLFTLVLGHAFYSVSALAAPHIAPTPRSVIENSDIERLLPNDEIKPLTVDDNEFLSLYNEYMSANFRGIVLLIPDWQSTPTNNTGINFLRKALNDIGYTTYAITVPDINWQAGDEPKPETNKAATDTTQNNTDNNTDPTAEQPHHVDYIAWVNTKVLDEYKTKLIARYEALHKVASAEQSKLVVIAQGTSAGVLLEYYAEFPESRINAFISLSGYLPNKQRNKSLNQTTSLISPALLDIYYAGDSNDILMNLKNRQRWVNRNAKFDYRQRQLFGFRDAPQQHARLSKEIDGFLRRIF